MFSYEPRFKYAYLEYAYDNRRYCNYLLYCKADQKKEKKTNGY